MSTKKLVSLIESLLCTALLFIFAAAAPAQTGVGGTIQGTVKDASGAVIQGASVSIRHVETGLITRTATNSEGFFSTPPINIGNYSVRVEHAGKKAWSGELTLETGRMVEIGPILQVGQLSETVVVTGNITPLVTTTDPTEASMLDHQRIQELPINGLNLNTLLEDVAAGVEAVQDVNGGIRVSGLMVYSTNYLQDGAVSSIPKHRIR